MSYFNMNRRIYADRKAPDGAISHGWRYVKEGGRVKFGGAWYSDEKLVDLKGEFVQVAMGDYWQGYVQIYRGFFGNTEWFCKARSVE